MNRLALGSGVLDGLDLTYDGKALKLGPGMAIDRIGRDLVVPAAVTVDITHVTDAQGNPTGPVPAGATTLEISLVYAEKKIDSVAVLVPDCNHPNGCAPSVIEEGYAIVVTSVAANTSPPDGGCHNSWFLLPPGPQLKTAIANRVARECAKIPSDTSIPLGRFTLPSGPVDSVSDRRLVYHNGLLFELITCLATRVSEIGGPWKLLISVSGNNQTGPASTALAKPLVAAAFDINGQQVSDGSPPAFTVTEGGGSVTGPASIGNGQYQVQWTLGTSGAQQATAKYGNFTVVFNATIQP
jgi:hypothetical protein